MASSAPPLARASWRSFSLFSKRGQTSPHHFIALHASILLLLLHFNANLRASLMFLHVLHCSCPCFIVAPPHALLCCFSLCFVAPCVLCYSSYFVVVHCVSLLFMLHCCSSCFVVPPHASLLLLVLRCYLSFFAAPTTLLLCDVLLLLHSLLLYRPLRYLSALCCFVTLLCFTIAWCFHCSLAQIGISPPFFLQWGNSNLFEKKLENI